MNTAANYRNFDYTNEKQWGPSALWLLPQTLALIARETKLVRNETGLYDGRATLSANMNLGGLGTENTIALYKYLLINPRSKITGKVELFLEYCHLVPLYLSAFKKYHDIPYSAWDRNSLKGVVDVALLKAIVTSVPEIFTLPGAAEYFIKMRNEFSYNGSPPEKAWKINITGSKEFDELPEFSKVMLCQIWMAHPSRRNKYMILNQNDWDLIPPPLVSTIVEVDMFADVPIIAPSASVITPPERVSTKKSKVSLENAESVGDIPWKKEPKYPWQT